MDRPFVLAAAVLVLLLVLAVRLAARSARGRASIHMAHVAEGGVLAVLLGGMIALSFVQIVLRNVANAGLVWIDPLLRHMVLWVGFLGALLATRSGRHINIDALSRLLSPRRLRVARVATHLLATIVTLLLANACFKLVVAEAGAGTTSFLDLPVWCLQAIMPVALVGMAVRFLGHAYDALRGRTRLAVGPAPEVQA